MISTTNDKSKKKKPNNINKKELWNIFNNEVENDNKPIAPLECIYSSSGNREFCERCGTILILHLDFLPYKGSVQPFS